MRQLRLTGKRPSPSRSTLLGVRRQLLGESLEPRIVLDASMVKDHKPSPLGSNLLFTSPRDQLVEAGDQIFFLAGDGAGRVSLWKSDGTEAGTVLVNDIQPGIGSSNPVYLVSFAGKLFFRANDGSSGTELWRSDGTEDGTALVRDIAHVSIASFPRSFANLNGL